MKIYKTPFGIIKTDILIFPLIYCIFLYGSKIIFPQTLYKGKDFFDLWTSYEFISEYFQFAFYFLSSISSLLIYFKSTKKDYFKNISWLIFSILYLFISYEEMSFYNFLNIRYIIDINTQGETNIHNLIYFEPYLVSIFIIVNLFLGWFGWRRNIKLKPLPSKKYCLYFLFCASFYTLTEMKAIITNTTFNLIPFPREAGEFLMALGIFLYTFNYFKLISRKPSKGI